MVASQTACTGGHFFSLASLYTLMGFVSIQRSSIHDVSSSESEAGTSPFVVATNSLHLSRKGKGFV